MNTYAWIDPPGQSAFPVARPGYPFIFGAGFTTAVLAIVGFKALALLGLGITVFICCFFRDPDRAIPVVDRAVVSPADGKVVLVDHVAGNPFSDQPCLKISVFMSVFNVHVNRIPYTGTVTGIRYFPGKFFNASLDKASKDNERNAIRIETEDGRGICFVQIAGLVARRIICNIREGDCLQRGQRFGMICFGSRLDVYLPENAEPNVAVGDKVRAGTSILGYLR
ncbi:MAG: phosphatidylserine decarboxylase family protein [Thermodesulfobacteriota bacterium]